MSVHNKLLPTFYFSNRRPLPSVSSRACFAVHQLARIDSPTLKTPIHLILCPLQAQLNNVYRKLVLFDLKNARTKQTFLFTYSYSFLSFFLNATLCMSVTIELVCFKSKPVWEVSLTDAYCLWTELFCSWNHVGVTLNKLASYIKNSSLKIYKHVQKQPKVYLERFKIFKTGGVLMIFMNVKTGRCFEMSLILVSKKAMTLTKAGDVKLLVLSSFDGEHKQHTAFIATPQFRIIFQSLNWKLWFPQTEIITKYHTLKSFISC